jgi:hypothetical protein
MIVITGLGRCGLSIIGQVLLSMNYKGGNDLQNYRLPSIHELNMDIYEQVKQRGAVNPSARCNNKYWDGYQYKEAIANVAKDDRQRPVHFIIDPCFMWHKEILKVWIRSRKDLKFLIIHRDFDKILDSYHRNPPDETELFRGNNVLKYKADFADCITTLRSFNFSYDIGLYPNFTKDGKTLFKKIRQLSNLHFCHMEASKIMKETLEET